MQARLELHEAEVEERSQTSSRRSVKANRQNVAELWNMSSVQPDPPDEYISEAHNVTAQGSGDGDIIMTNGEHAGFGPSLAERFNNRPFVTAMHHGNVERRVGGEVKDRIASLEAKRQSCL